MSCLEMLNLQILITINEFLKKFRISRRILFLILSLLLLQAVLEALSAGLLVPFLVSFQNVTGATHESDNKIILFMSLFFKGIETENRFVYILLTIMLIMSLVQCLVIFSNRLIYRFSSFEVQYKVSNILFSKILDSKLKFLYKQRSGNLINQLTRDVDRCNTCLNRLLQMVSNLFFEVGYVVISFLILPFYTLCFIVVLGGVLILHKKFLPYMYSIGVENRTAQQDANNVIVETIQGFRNIILLTAQKISNNKFREIMSKYYTTVYKSAWIGASLSPFFKFLSFVLIVILLFFLKGKLIGGDREYFARMVFFVYIIGNVFRYMGAINSFNAAFAFGYEGVVALTKLDAVLDDYKEQNSLCIRKKQDFKSIVVRNMSYEYVRGKRVLDNISFSIMKNERVAFVGSSGSGKSTLVDIISGFHDDYSGSIKIDDLELRNIIKKDWRTLLGYVSQETFIFNETVRNNLLFGFQRDISEDELIDACKKAQIYETTMSFENKFDTVLGERGIRLSGGEKQRFAIARLFLKNPLIILLDEATSALDSASEKKVKDALDVLGRGRTVIAVAHRLSTVADYDRIYVMENGGVVESGTHTELVERKSYYYKYWLFQSLKS